MKVFLDTNVIVDFMAERKPFFLDAATIFDMHRNGEIELSASSLTLVNCAYIIQKAYSKDTMLSKIEWLCDNMDITSVDKADILNAVKSGKRDFEDKVQYFSSMRSHPDIILTRDKKGFADLGIPAMTPAEFIAASR